MTPKQLNALVSDALDQNKFDQVLNVDQFNALNKQQLMNLEIHELMEAGKIDLVVEDNTTDRPCAIVTVVGKNVLVIHPLCQYAEWRKIYDNA